jgi:nucleoside-diphosphate-sugar epimerase
MKILILGASQGTGAEAARIAVERGHDATAFARSPDKLVLQHPKLTKRSGDFHQRDSVDAAVTGHDAVIITASATSLRGFRQNPTYFSQGTGHTIEAMKKHGVRRLVVLSAWGTGESRKLANFFVDKLVISLLLKRRRSRARTWPTSSSAPWRSTHGSGRRCSWGAEGVRSRFVR